jgi:transposase
VGAARAAPRQDGRRSVNVLLWRRATGAPGRDLPEQSGPWQTVSTRFWRWPRAGVWNRILAAVQQAADAASELDWESHVVAGMVVWVHQHAAGAKGGPCGGRARAELG